MGHETKSHAGTGTSALQTALWRESALNRRPNLPSVKTPQIPDTSGTAVLNISVSFYMGWITCGLEHESVVFSSQLEQERVTASYLFFSLALVLDRPRWPPLAGLAAVRFRLFIFGCVSRDTLITYMAVISIPAIMSFYITGSAEYVSRRGYFLSFLGIYK